MGRRKFKLSTHWKNEERSKRGKPNYRTKLRIQEPEHGLFHCYTDMLFDGISPLEQSLEEPRTLDISQAECNILQNSVMQSDASVPETRCY